ncbi:MAG: 50S ribosomal protein L23 [Blastocatellia bacterium]
MKTIWNIIKTPVITEKALDLKEKGLENGKQVLAFRVDGDASKHAIKSAVERIFKVKVATVRVVNYKGKSVRRGRFVGKRPDWRKAYVTLVEGEREFDYGDAIQ